MRYLIFILFFSITANSQTIPINGTGTPVRINAPGIASTVTINYEVAEDFSPVDYTGTINTSLQNLTEGEASTYYYGWPMTYAVQDKRAIVARRGAIHSYYDGSDMVRILTSDGANSWVIDSIFSEPGVDVRNYGGGTTSDGVILIFYGRMTSGSTWGRSRVLRSIDGGATFTPSGDLETVPDMITVSPSGRLVELDNGDLLQSFYGRNVDATTKSIFTLKSTDNGLTWGDVVLVDSGVNLNEPSIASLGSGKLIAAVRHDIGATDFDAEIYNSSDNGATWDSIGKGIYGASGADMPGTAPLIFKKNADTATLILTARGTENSFLEIDLPFGTATSTSLRRVFYDAHDDISGNNIEFGYAAPLLFNSPDSAKLIAFYDVASEWVSGDALTDIYVNQIYRRKLSVTRKEGGTITSGSFYVPTFYVIDEIPVINPPNNFRHKITTETGSYSIRVEATFTGTGSSRDLIVRRYDAAGVFIENMFTESGSGNSFDFTTTQTMQQDESIAVQVIHDASPLTVTIIRMTITKL